jgi:hypothetical protein
MLGLWWPRKGSLVVVLLQKLPLTFPRVSVPHKGANLLWALLETCTESLLFRKRSHRHHLQANTLFLKIYLIKFREAQDIAGDCLLEDLDDFISK